jgi:phage shock protein E
MNSTTIMVVLAIVALIGLAIAANQGKGDVGAVKALIAQGALVIDVRTAEEFAAGHLEGALNIPYDVIATKLDTIGPDKQRSVVVYCRSGRRSGIAQQTLKSHGYTNVVNGGAFTDLK